MISKNKLTIYIVLTIILLSLFYLIITSSLTTHASNLRVNFEYKQDRYNKSLFKLYFNNKKLYIPDFHVRGIYVSGWVAGLQDRMQSLINLVDNSILNTMVIDVKDELGYLSYYSKIELSREIGSGKNKISDMKQLLKDLNNKGIYTIARIVVFKDSILAQERPELALELINNKNEIFLSNNWVNPSAKEVWNYNIQLAREVLEMGFDEVQFDYIRFPALANKPIKVLLDHDFNKSEVINKFLQTVRIRLKDLSKPISIDVFGLTTSAPGDLGIGQNFTSLIETVNIISPMLYPSHYAPGSFGLASPEMQPYHVINKSIKDAQKKINVTNNVKIRPWLQDFSLNYTYSVDEIKKQLAALKDLGIKEWLLWNSRSQYTEEVFLGPPF